MGHFEQRQLFEQPLASAAGGRITSISLSSQAHLSRTLLAGMLLELSGNSDQRWLCWVADRPLKPLLTANSSNQQRILQVVSNSGQELCPIAVRALERGKSHTVAVLLDRPLQDREHEALERAALAGNAECLVIYLND